MLVAVVVLLAGAVALVSPVLAEAADAAVSGSWRTAGFEDLLVWVAGLVATLCLSWLALVSGLVAVQAARGQVTATGRWCPTGLRRWVLLACGASLALGTVVPAQADSRAAMASSEVRQVARAGALSPASLLDGLALPDRPSDTRRPRSVHPRPAPHAPKAPDVHRVVAGDCLWDIARDQLAPGTADAEVASYTLALYLANRSQIGSDPDLIRPGTTLRLPRP